MIDMTENRRNIDRYGRFLILTVTSANEALNGYVKVSSVMKLTAFLIPASFCLFSFFSHYNFNNTN